MLIAIVTSGSGVQKTAKVFTGLCIVSSGIKERAELTFPVEGWAPLTAFVRFQNKKEAVQAMRTLQKWKPGESKGKRINII